MKPEISPHHQARVRARTAEQMWRKLHELSRGDAQREKVQLAYLQLTDLLHGLPYEARMVIGGTIARARF